jgi:hypothetical protein
MPLRLNARWRPPTEQGPWLTGMPIFAESTAYERLLRELRRYVEDEVSGRSILIAGHRGAGKTSTVLQAVRVLRDEILQRSRNLEDPGLSRRRNLQRPLLVKLVGKGLLEPLPASPGQPSVGRAGSGDPAKAAPSRAQDPDSSDPAKTALGGTQGPNSSVPQSGSRGSQGGPNNPTVAMAEEHAASALAHITVALYRALAREVALGFANHVRDGGHDPEHAELAAQLALELDSNPDAATLRNFWDEVGRLEDGVLFWKDSDPTLAHFQLRNQGVREIIAVTTAAQAFEICLGAVSGQVDRADEGSRENEATISGDIKDLVTRLGTLAAGTAAGSVAGVSANSAATGVGIGLLVFLLAGLTMSFQSTRKRKRTSKVTYTFIRDRTIQTLDRDLPHVLDRVRQAGLAPIFVIDELDKLTDPDTVISGLIGRLKHLISDYGFFCFLADRDYLDRIERKLADGSYPVEHTYFTDRLLVVNRPSDLRAFLEDLILQTPATADGEMVRRTLA